MVYLCKPRQPGFSPQCRPPAAVLVGLTPAGLRQLLDDAGIKWRIVVGFRVLFGGIHRGRCRTTTR